MRILRTIAVIAICLTLLGCGGKDSSKSDPLFQALRDAAALPDADSVYLATKRLAEPLLSGGNINFAKQAKVDRVYGVGKTENVAAISWKVSGTYKSNEQEHRFKAALDYARENKQHEPGEKVLQVGNGMEFHLITLHLDDNEAFISPALKAVQDELARQLEVRQKEFDQQRKAAEKSSKS